MYYIHLTTSLYHGTAAEHLVKEKLFYLFFKYNLLTLPPCQRQVNQSVQLVWRTRQRSEWWLHLPPPYSIIWRGNVGAQWCGVHLRANPGTLPSPQCLDWKSAVDCGFVRQESLREQFGSVCVCVGRSRTVSYALPLAALVCTLVAFI